MRFALASGMSANRIGLHPCRASALRPSPYMPCCLCGRQPRRICQALVLSKASAAESLSANSHRKGRVRLSSACAYRQIWRTTDVSRSASASLLWHSATWRCRSLAFIASRQPFPIAVSGDDELLTDASGAQRARECVDEAPTLSDVKTFAPDVARCAKKLRLRYPSCRKACSANPNKATHAGAPERYTNVEFDDFDPHQGTKPISCRLIEQRRKYLALPSTNTEVTLRP